MDLKNFLTPILLLVSSACGAPDRGTPDDGGCEPASQVLDSGACDTHLEAGRVIEAIECAADVLGDPSPFACQSQIPADCFGACQGDRCDECTETIDDCNQGILESDARRAVMSILCEDGDEGACEESSAFECEG